MRTRIVPLFALLLALLLTACSVINPPAKQRKSALDDFTYALRWQRYPEASQFFVREQRRAFLDQVDALKGLNITDVRLKRIDQGVDGRQADVRIEVDYYLLPSATLKTLQVDQTWAYFETPDTDGNGFLITTPFPKIP